MSTTTLNSSITLLWSTVKKIFTYTGRATRKEFWTFTVAAWCLNIVFGVVAAAMGAIAEILGMAILGIFLIVSIVEMLIWLSLSVRRLHDIDLSGFWLLYLNPAFGLPLVFIVYLLGIDGSCDKVVDNIAKVGSPWLGWILTLLLWPAGVVGVLFLLFLYAGKDQANSFGESPYSAN